jgi:outer membrane protein
MLLVSASAFAQGFKIGYTQIDAIVFSMPEMVSVDADLKVYQAQLASLVNTKKVEFDNKMNEYQVIAQQPTTLPAVLQEKQVELQRLDADFNDFQAKSQQSYGAKQQELYSPIYIKVQEAIIAVRTEKGYAMILNSRTQDGSQVILAAEDADDITEAVFAKLGVPMPTQERAPADSTGSGN